MVLMNNKIDKNAIIVASQENNEVSVKVGMVIINRTTLNSGLSDHPFNSSPVHGNMQMSMVTISK